MKNSRKLLSIILVLLFIGVVTAGLVLFVFPYDPLTPPAADDSGSTQQGISQVVEANNKFAFDLYKELNNDPELENKNLFFSPYSISSALAMTYEGAREQTAEEIKNVFYFPEPEALRPNFAAVYNQINKEDKSYTLRTGNALWVQKDYPLLEAYISNVENYYGSKASNLDFVNQNEKSRVTINSFIEKQTNNRIKELIKPGMLSLDTRLVITNAIYFLGDWKYQFDKKNTKDLDFFVTPDSSIKVPMMHMSSKDMKDMKPEPAKFNFADLEKVQLLELPYKDEELSMIIVLPKQGRVQDPMTGETTFEYNYTLNDIDISFDKFSEYKSQMQETSLDAIYLPSFKFETDYKLNDSLAKLGMPSAFLQGAADFSGLNGQKNLFISSVIHKAFIKVDEKGTEAAAVTAVDIAQSAQLKLPKIFRADHPFFFVIQEKQTGNILFLGKVIDPRD